MPPSGVLAWILSPGWVDVTSVTTPDTGARISRKLSLSMFSKRTRAAASATQARGLQLQAQLLLDRGELVRRRLVLQPQLVQLLAARLDLGLRLRELLGLPRAQLAEPRLRHPLGVLGGQQGVLLGVDLQLRHPAAAGRREHALELLGLGLGRVARAARFLEVRARLVDLRPLRLRQLAWFRGRARFSCCCSSSSIACRRVAALRSSSAFFSGNCRHSRSASSSLSCACMRVGRRFDRARGR